MECDDAELMQSDLCQSAGDIAVKQLDALTDLGEKTSKSGGQGR